MLLPRMRGALTQSCALSLTSFSLAVQDIIWKTQLQTNEVSALGLNAAEGYHAGAIRQQLIQQRLSAVPGLGMNVQTLALVRGAGSSYPAAPEHRTLSGHELLDSHPGGY